LGKVEAGIFSIQREATYMTECDDDLITTTAACILLGGQEAPINPSTLWRWIKAGRFSPPLKPGPGTVRFRRSVLIAERDAVAA
jgi:predicted DNA-binding transcriptional regulator AlpA